MKRNIFFLAALFLYQPVQSGDGAQNFNPEEYSKQAYFSGCVNGAVNALVTRCIAQGLYEMLDMRLAPIALPLSCFLIGYGLPVKIFKFTVPEHINDDVQKVALQNIHDTGHSTGLWGMLGALPMIENNVLKISPVRSLDYSWGLLTVLAAKNAYYGGSQMSTFNASNRQRNS